MNGFWNHPANRAGGESVVKINYYLWRIQRNQLIGNRVNQELTDHLGELGRIMGRLRDRTSLAKRVASNIREKWQQHEHQNDALIKMMRDKWGVEFHNISRVQNAVMGEASNVERLSDSVGDQSRDASYGHYEHKGSSFKHPL